MKIDRKDERFDRAVSENGMWLFNGETFTNEVSKPKGTDFSDWQEVSEEFKVQWEAEEREKMGV